MSQHHADPVEENIETHPVKLAIAIIIGAVGLVVGIIMLAYFAIGSHQVGAADDRAHTPEAIGQRIAPATILVVEPAKAAAPAPIATVAPKAGGAPVVAMAVPATSPTAAALPGGESVYKSACSACHATGVAGAPKTGDKGSWGVRAAKGKQLLYDHALKGFNAMPAKGGNPTLADADVKSAVDFMVAQVK